MDKIVENYRVFFGGWWMRKQHWTTFWIFVVSMAGGCTVAGFATVGSISANSSGNGIAVMASGLFDLVTYLIALSLALVFGGAIKITPASYLNFMEESGNLKLKGSSDVAFRGLKFASRCTRCFGDIASYGKNLPRDLGAGPSILCRREQRVNLDGLSLAQRSGKDQATRSTRKEASPKRPKNFLEFTDTAKTNHQQLHVYVYETI